MGVLVGLLLGSGLFLIVQSYGPPRTAGRKWRRREVERLTDMLTQAGIEAVTPAGLLGSCLATAAVGFTTLLALSGSPVLAGAFAVISAFGPFTLVRMRQRRRRDELRELWPEVVDNLVSAIRAGLSLPEALGQLATRGPEPLRPAFARFGADFRATGRFSDCLDRLKVSLADPTADRILEALRMAREVGGSDLGDLLRTLAAFLREDARTRAELEARQGWTVNGARLAVAAPWIVLLMLSTNQEAARAFNSSSGALVLACGGAVSVLAYRLMIRIGRLPIEQRVLR